MRLVFLAWRPTKRVYTCALAEPKKGKKGLNSLRAVSAAAWVVALFLSSGLVWSTGLAAGGSGVVPVRSLAFSALRFNPFCKPGRRYYIAAVGDLLLHGRLQKKAALAGSYAGFWRFFTPYFQQADIAYANLEGPSAEGVSRYNRSVPDPGLVFDNLVYTSYPRFNYPPTVLDDLTRSGFDVVSTANNHALDRGSMGVDRTIAVLQRAGLNYTGTRPASHGRFFHPWHTIVRRNGLTTAWISCTFFVNGLRDPHDQVLRCQERIGEIKQLISQLRHQVDAVFVTPHWGAEYESRPRDSQIRFAREVLESGALAVLGSHPHILQPMTKYLTHDGRETFIIYSLGNFVHGQRQVARKSTVILVLGLTKTSGLTVINGVRFVPAFMTQEKGAWILKPLRRGGGHPGLDHIFKTLPVSRMLDYGQKVVTDDHCRRSAVPNSR